MSLKVCIEGAPANECLIQESGNILLSYKSCVSEGAAGSLLRQQLKGLILQMWGCDVQRELSLFQRDFLDPVGRGGAPRKQYTFSLSNNLCDQCH